MRIGGKYYKVQTSSETRDITYQQVGREPIPQEPQPLVDTPVW